MNNLKERLQEIVETSYRLLCNKIVGCLVDIDNEASMQMQLGVIMKTIGHLYEFSPEDRFSITLERIVKSDNIQTWKSKGKARIDIVLTLSNNKETCSAALELKFFPKSDGETVTDNRFYVLADLENLETYRHLGIADLCYFILYTTNQNYTTDTRSGVKIGNEDTISGEISSNNRIVKLSGSHKLHWDIYEDGKHCFLLQQI